MYFLSCEEIKTFHLFIYLFIQTLLFQACLPTRQNGVENRGGVHSKIMHILVQEFVSSRKYIVSYLVFFASFRFLEE